jgi:hypothetical protein
MVHGLPKEHDNRVGTHQDSDITDLPGGIVRQNGLRIGL